MTRAQIIKSYVAAKFDPPYVIVLATQEFEKCDVCIDGVRES